MCDNKVIHKQPCSRYIKVVVFRKVIISHQSTITLRKRNLLVVLTESTPSASQCQKPIKPPIKQLHINKSIFSPTNSNKYTVFPTRKRLQPMFALIERQFFPLTPLFGNNGFPRKLQVLKLLQAASNPGIRNCSLLEKKKTSCHTPLNLLNFNFLRINLEIHLAKKWNVYPQYSN